jgi:hypothetical protein
MNQLNITIFRMCGLYGLRSIGLVVFISLCSINCSVAQNATLEFWPETDIWYSLSPSWRLSAFVPITKYNESGNRDLNVYLQADYKWGRTKYSVFERMMDENRVGQIKSWMVRGGFMEGWSLGENAGEYTEDMLFMEFHKRIPLKRSGMLISSRIRNDFRWVGQDPAFSYRFRFRFMVEREFTAGRTSIVPYWNVEPYWDSRYTTFNRVRLILGTTLAVGRRFAYETNITYQHDPHYDSTNMYALNLILHVFFETKHSREKSQ